MKNIQNKIDGSLEDAEFCSESFEKLLKSETGLKVSPDSAVKLRDLAEKRGTVISFVAHRIADGQGRNSVTADDVETAVEFLTLDLERVAGTENVSAALNVLQQGRKPVDRKIKEVKAADV